MFNKLYRSIEYGRDMEKDILMKVDIIYIKWRIINIM